MTGLDYLIMNKHNIVVIWSPEVINLLEERQIGGIAVQMYFWAQVFRDNGWEVYSLTYDNEKQKEGIHFKRQRNVKRINFILEWWYAVKYILSIKPDIIIYRGANRNLFPLAVVAKVFHKKLIFFGASDVNFEPDKEITATGFNGKCYRRAIPMVSKIIVQNQFQHDALLQNYGRESLKLSNLWGNLKDDIKIEERYDVIWVANFRRLKRAEWVLEAAKNNPSYTFAIVGGPGEERYFEEIRSLAEGIPNVSFLGPKSFFESNALIKNSRLLLCTSNFEGFPNTFLQAWFFKLPVISTVDPSEVIKMNELGKVITSIEELSQSIESVLIDTEYYERLRNNVKLYFLKNHSGKIKYEQLMKYVNELN